MTPQQKMQEALGLCGIPAKEIKCYGSQIVITAWSRDAAEKRASLVARFATFRGIVESVEYTRDPSHFTKANPGLVKSAFTHPVWRVFGRV